ncbi:MAG: OmpA family protein [Azonexaceae bacterium]|nr:OmpA family protein [Azonexaceae bacterium]
MRFRIFLAVLLFLLSGTSFGDTAHDVGKVVASGNVPDESSRAAILERLRAIYGTANVVDKLEVGGVVPPPGWSDNMNKILTEDIKQITKGQFRVNGTQIALRGNVASEIVRKQLAGNMAAALNPTYSIDNALVVLGGEGQGILDKVLANRVVEFESSSANLTPLGKGVLDEMYEAIRQIGFPKIQLIGHTDSSGGYQWNVALSLSRANSVKNYLVAKGVSSDNLSVFGVGPDQPVATNDTIEGRARNRRIEFKLVK